MNKPVYGFEKNYVINENGILYSIKNELLKEIKPIKSASRRQDRYRLVDNKYYDAKYLVFKSFHPECNLEINDERIIFIDGDPRNASIYNLKIIDKNNRNEIALFLSEKYQEKIKPILEYENYYISEKGRIFSYYNSSSRELKPYLGTDGYLQVKVPNNFGNAVHLKIHRLVAEYFVTNLNSKDFQVVHHKDENKTNNYYLNFECTTSQKNNEYAFGKKCCMLDESFCILSIHGSIADLARYYQVDNSTASKQCRGEKNQFKNGYRARFFNEELHNFIPTQFD